MLVLGAHTLAMTWAAAWKTCGGASALLQEVPDRADVEDRILT
ncbi:hypothetical protein [Mycobacterium sp. ACS4331]|nr:hypothetical protein [Mycobacterium sp. ACS4331]